MLGSTEADKPGKPREKFLEHVREVLQFNEKHPAGRFDGLHLDIEPQQRPENKGGDNLAFLPDLIETFRAVNSLAAPAKLTVNADIAHRFLKADVQQRKLLLSSVPRLTLMRYEVSSLGDGKSPASKAEKLRKACEKSLTMAYAGLNEPKLARMVIALRTPDYGDLLPAMLKTLDDAYRRNPRYLGWGMHSYNDHLKQVKSGRSGVAVARCSAHKSGRAQLRHPIRQGTHSPAALLRDASPNSIVMEKVMPDASSWQWFALGSAFFAGLTAILGKVGVAEINFEPASNADPDHHTHGFECGLVITLRGEWEPLNKLSCRGVLMLCLSGVATGLSWLCYYRTCQNRGRHRG